MTPPMNDIISPTGKTIRALKELAANHETVSQSEDYLAQLEHIQHLAEKSSASRKLFLFAPDFGETE